MGFSYYTRLSETQKRVYRQSDSISFISLKQTTELFELVDLLASTLETKDTRLVQNVCQQLSDRILDELQVEKIPVEILSVRPSNDWGELHGLYFQKVDGQHPKIQLWMRTAQHKRVVAFKTFLRTFLHEICHHLDYELHKLPDSLHTEGFYKRISSLFNQLNSN